jgi:hypothetical protein
VVFDLPSGQLPQVLVGEYKSKPVNFLLAQSFPQHICDECARKRKSLLKKCQEMSKNSAIKADIDVQALETVIHQALEPFLRELSHGTSLALLDFDEIAPHLISLRNQSYAQNYQEGGHNIVHRLECLVVGFQRKIASFFKNAGLVSQRRKKSEA